MLLVKYKMEPQLWRTVCVFLKWLIIELPYHPGHVPKREEDTCAGSLYTGVYHSAIHDSQKAGTTEVSTEWVGETCCACPAGYSLAIKWSPGTCNNTDEPWEHVERSSHRGAHNVVFLCQLGARPRASGVTHAACLFTGSPRARVPSVGMLAPSPFRAPG